jgi:hypothetical protein
VSPSDRVAQLYPPGTGFPFRRLLRLAGLLWRYSNPPPHGDLKVNSKIKWISWGCIKSSCLENSAVCLSAVVDMRAILLPLQGTVCNVLTAYCHPDSCDNGVYECNLPVNNIRPDNGRLLTATSVTPIPQAPPNPSAMEWGNITHRLFPPKFSLAQFNFLLCGSPKYWELSTTPVQCSVPLLRITGVPGSNRDLRASNLKSHNYLY